MVLVSIDTIINIRLYTNNSMHRTLTTKTIQSQMVKFSAKKISSLTLSGLSCDLPCTIFPPVLNSLSDGTLVAYKHKYFRIRANFAGKGNW